ncbi:carbohydrate kinase [Arthrobacter sp. Rue61a]|uniref:carbohydrate kinase family protein n=1 Tax=Arthrobacter sp. Rue61a TaxID=1118963 RepID=UPI00027DF8B5|nr:carbohydrate kinase [Arthrobacter sp. Rue61a]AFR28997.1 fructokinase Frk [Arthrobacter sp. Rue61a]
MDYLRTASPQTHPALDVMVVGEALMDVVTAGNRKVEHPGGSPANVAYGLARLGVGTGLLTAIAPDDRGRRIEEHLRSAGVILLPGSRSLTRTASATATVAPDGSAHYDFDISWDLAHQTPAFFPKILHTGSIATFLHPGASVVKSLLEQAHRHCVITYDPNIRPALLGSHVEAKAIFEELVTFTDVVKLSDEDAQWLYPGRSMDEAAAYILGLGTSLAVITKGAEGAHFATPGFSVSIPAAKTRVTDTIGAGDSFMSALILGLLNRGTEGFAPAVLDQLGHAAAAAAAITVQRPGANPPTLEELNAVLESQRVG